MERFVKEWIIAQPNTDDRKRLIKDIKSIWDRNNDRNRCIFTLSKVQGVLDYIGNRVDLNGAHDGSMLDTMINEEDRLEKEKRIVSHLDNPFIKYKKPKISAVK